MAVMFDVGHEGAATPNDCLTILDCTFRDGGYYNNWDYDPATIPRYLEAVARAGVDIVEIGFRMPPQPTFLGPFAYSTDAYLNTLPIPEDMTIAVMVNASDVFCADTNPSSAIDALFSRAENSVVSVVRIAAHAKHVSGCKEIARRLVELGYRVMLNVMQAGSYAAAELTKVAAEVDGWGTVEALYFADSLGNMDAVSVRTTAIAFAAGWKKPIGFHSHNNRGLAVTNSLAALAAGVSHLDSTISGMGRGAGNAQTELLLVELARGGAEKYVPEAIFPLALSDFADMQRRYGWGQNLYYYLAAEYSIHPTYIQELLSDGRHKPDDIFAAIKFLRETGAKSFDASTLRRATFGAEPNGSGGGGTWNAEGWAQGRTVVIVGAGPQGERHLAAVADFVRQNDTLVLCLNVNKLFPPELVSAYVTCRDSRIMTEAYQYKHLKRPLFVPLARVPEDVRKNLGEVEVRDYGLDVARDVIGIRSTGCTLPQSLEALTTAYAMALAIVGRAARVLLVGFDGYAVGDPRQEEMIEVFDRIQALSPQLPIAAITPTSYPISQRSVYEPAL